MYVLDGIINGIIHRDIMLTFYYLSVHILKSGIDIGKRMKVGPIKFAKKNKPAI